MQRFRKQKGFTLIEAIVSAALFAFVVTSILGVYVAVLKLNTRTRAQRALAQNSRFITEFLSKEIRNGRIDYSKSNTTTHVYLVNQNNESEDIFWGTSPTTPIVNASSCANATCSLYLNKSAGTTTLNASSVEVTNLTFYLYPAGDPYTVSKTYNEQPHVTMILELTPNINTRDKEKINLQSTFSELYYPPRQ